MRVYEQDKESLRERLNVLTAAERGPLTYIELVALAKIEESAAWTLRFALMRSYLHEWNGDWSLSLKGHKELKRLQRLKAQGDLDD